MRIGIIGAGAMGEILARRLGGIGHRVTVASARGAERLAPWAAEVGARPASVVDVANHTDVVVLAIPTRAVPELPRGVFASAPSALVVVDITNYHPELRDGRIDEIEQGMPDSAWVAERIGRPVIKAFNHVFAASLRDKGVPSGAPRRVALSVCGDASRGKSTVLRLVDELGFDAVDGGGLAESWRQQPGTPAYCKDLDADALRRALAAAEPGRIAEYRAQEEARIRRSL